MDLVLVALSPLPVWAVYCLCTRTLNDAEPLVLAALTLTPSQALSEAELRQITGLTEQQLAITLRRLRRQVSRTPDLVTLL